MLDSDDSSLLSQPTEDPTERRQRPLGKDDVPYDGTIRLVGHRVREVDHGLVQVEAQITCEGRTFNGAASGPLGPPDRLRVPALTRHGFPEEAFELAPARFSTNGLSR